MRRPSYMARMRRDAGLLGAKPTPELRAEIVRTDAAINMLLQDIATSTAPKVDLLFQTRYFEFATRWNAWAHEDGALPEISFGTLETLRQFGADYRVWRKNFTDRGGTASGPSLPPPPPPDFGSPAAGVAKAASSLALLVAVGVGAYFLLKMKG